MEKKEEREILGLKNEERLEKDSINISEDSNDNLISLEGTQQPRIDPEFYKTIATLLYGKEVAENWAQTAFKLLIQNLALKMHNLLEVEMKNAGINLDEDEEVNTRGIKKPSLIYNLGKMLYDFYERRKRDEGKAFITKRKEASILKKIGESLLALIKENERNWLNIDKPIRKSKPKKGTLVNPKKGSELFRQFSRVAELIPEEYIDDDLSYTHYTYIAQRKKEDLDDRKTRIPVLMELLIYRIKDTSKRKWTISDTYELSGKFIKANRDRLGKRVIQRMIDDIDSKYKKSESLQTKRI